MAHLSIAGIRKNYSETVQVLNSINIDIDSGEFFTLLGPSGCGKTTLLRIIAGFLRQNAGTVTLGGEPLDPKPAHKRDIGMVFQDYAIFPHLTVQENVAFGLKARQLSRAETEARVKEALHTVRLSGFESRFPAELSGGQQQRVGLARAMAIRPKLLLMDEPLSNLDAKLRVELREDIREIQNRLGITTIYVTHDQEEALAVSDRICVMHKGRAEQIGTPFDIYHHPRRRFVAGFVGTMNFLTASLEGAGVLGLGDIRVPLPISEPSGSVDIAVRPENVMLAGDRRLTGTAVPLRGIVRKVTFLGREAHYLVDTPAGSLTVQLPDPTPELLGATGSTVELRLPLERLCVFDAAGNALLEPRP